MIKLKCLEDIMLTKYSGDSLYNLFKKLAEVKEISGLYSEDVDITKYPLGNKVKDDIINMANSQIDGASSIFDKISLFADYPTAFRNDIASVMLSIPKSIMLFRPELLEDIKVTVEAEDLKGDTIFLSSWNITEKSRTLVFSKNPRIMKMSEYLEALWVSHNCEGVFVECENSHISPTVVWFKMIPHIVSHTITKWSEAETTVISLILNRIPKGIVPDRVTMENRASNHLIKIEEENNER